MTRKLSLGAWNALAMAAAMGASLRLPRPDPLPTLEAVLSSSEAQRKAKEKRARRAARNLRHTKKEPCR